MNDKTFKIGDVAALLDTTVRTIRYYEEEGLLLPERTEGGTRFYTEHHVKRLKAIIHLVSNGFTIDVVRIISGMRKKCKTGNEGSEKVASVIDNSIDDIDEKIIRLEALKSEFFIAKKQILKCKGCKNKPSSKGCPGCPVIKNLTKSEVLNLVWE